MQLHNGSVAKVRWVHKGRPARSKMHSSQDNKGLDKHLACLQEQKWIDGPILGQILDWVKCCVCFMTKPILMHNYALWQIVLLLGFV